LSKDIEDVEIGDEVLATDPETGESGPRRVTRLIVTEEDKHFNELSIATEDGVEKLTATHEHPFWSPSALLWVEARDLKPGMTLLTDKGDTVIVTANRAFTRHARTYNLTVDDLHTYYVLAGETPVLVHNSDCWSVKARMRAAGPGDEFGLPNQGRIRYVPPKNYNPANPLPRGRNGGYIDRFGNEWTVGPSRTEGHPFEWDVQLSRQGREKIGWLSRDNRHVNVDPFGEVTHR
jgi:hypothetical protein